MLKTTLSIGLNDKDTKTQLVTTKNAISIIKQAVTEIGGGTVLQGTGIYTHDSGEVVQENTIQVILYDCTMENVKSLVNGLKYELNQESIAVEQSDIISMFL